MTGLRNNVVYEGQAAMELEMAAEQLSDEAYDYTWSGTDVISIEPQPIISGVVKDIEAKVSSAVVSAKFHATIVAVFTELCQHLRKRTGIGRVALSGGCFQNALLLGGFLKRLNEYGFEVLTHEKAPANDGGIALGQAVIADALAA